MANVELLKELAQIRKTSGLTQAELAKKLGVPQSSIARMETSSADVRLSRFVEMARVLDREIVLVPKELEMVVRALISKDGNKDLANSPAYASETNQPEYWNNWTPLEQ